MVPSAPADLSTAAGLPARLLTLCPSLTTAKALCVALSGGLDSMVLLHLLLQLQTNGLLPARLRALHIHHGLQSDADKWQQHCRQWCEQWQLPFVACKVSVNQQQGESLEAAAREARYTAFAAELQPGEVLVQAHHANDQAETLLLRLLRGSGLQGLGGMPAARELAQGSLLRPLLAVTREELHDYATTHALPWVEDPSNADPRFDRNYLRATLMPLLQARWPAAVLSLGRSAELAQEAAGLLDALAAQDLAAAPAEFPNRLPLSLLRPLDPARQRNLLRHWLAQQPLQLQGAAMSYQNLQRAIAELVTPPACEHVWLEWGEGEQVLQLHRYRDWLYLLKPLPPAPAARLWNLVQPLGLPAPLGSLHWHIPGKSVIDLPQQLQLRFRSGSEHMVKADGHHQSLKNHWQQRGIPPWLRDCVPLLYHGEELVAIGEEILAGSTLGKIVGNMRPLAWQRAVLLCGW
ncbi:MAG: tRNA lysidine(34) synthetase TilS [Pseudomonadota bacterium]